MAYTTSFPSTSFNSLTTTPFHRTRHSPPTHVTFRRSPPPISAAYTTTTTTLPPPSTTSLQTTTSFYEILGVGACASVKEIKAAYRKLARTLHPDVSNGEKDATSSAEEFIRVNEAYATLSDPKKRADYDRIMWLQGRRLNYYSPTYCSRGANKYTTTSFSEFLGHSTRRNWETDQCW